MTLNKFHKYYCFNFHYMKSTIQNVEEIDITLGMLYKNVKTSAL